MVSDEVDASDQVSVPIVYISIMSIGEGGKLFNHVVDEVNGLQQASNMEGENETEFESAKTLMLGESHQVDEIGALIGHECSIAEMQTINTRSPGPSVRSKKS